MLSFLVYTVLLLILESFHATAIKLWKSILSFQENQNNWNLHLMLERTQKGECPKKG